jgi:hypothetical protein
MSSKLSFSLIIFCFIVNISTLLGQDIDSTKSKVNFSGNIGFTSNGFSIIPTFSLNSPATIMNFSFRKKRLSFEPDIRLVPKLNKGGFLFWLRYRLIEKKKFTFRMGAHPAFSLIRRTIISNNADQEITEMLRFAAWEAVPSYQFTPHFGMSALFLQGHGLQNHGPQMTNALFLNMAFSDLNVGSKVLVSFFPSIYYLHLDHKSGKYVSAMLKIGHKKSPFSIQSNINQTITSSIPGNKEFIWNVGLNYGFNMAFNKE